MTGGPLGFFIYDQSCGTEYFCFAPGCAVVTAFFASIPTLYAPFLFELVQELHFLCGVGVRV